MTNSFSSRRLVAWTTPVALALTALTALAPALPAQAAARPTPAVTAGQVQTPATNIGLRGNGATGNNSPADFDGAQVKDQDCCRPTSVSAGYLLAVSPPVGLGLSSPAGLAVRMAVQRSPAIQGTASLRP